MAAEREGCRRILADVLKPICGSTADATATRLVTQLGSLPDVLAASRREQLRAADGDERVVQHLRVIREATVRAHRLALDRRPVIGNERALLDYLQLVQGSDIIEQVRVLYLDTQHHLIRDELASRGTVDEAPIYVRSIIARALELGASGLILAHNHPSGSSQPSDTDRDVTAKLAAAAQTMSIVLHDHVIVARGRHFSFKAQGLL